MASEVTAIGKLDYLFYALPSSLTAGGLCWLETGASEPSSTSNEPEPVLPQLVTAPPSHHVLDIVAENVIPFVRDSTDIVEWHVVWNPQAGRRVTEAWLEKLVIPILTFAGARFKVHESVLPTVATVQEDNLYQEIFGLHPDQETHLKLTLKVIIMGGDGTTSDYLNQVVRYDPLSGRLIVPNSELIIIPLGTANALFFSAHPSARALEQPRVVLSSLLTALFSTTTALSTSKQLQKPLPLAHIRILNSDQKLARQAIAHVVASTALHASILHTADELRGSSEFKGSGRFREAFRRNNTRLWDATLHLLPVPAEDMHSCDSVFRYDRAANKLVEISKPQGKLIIEGGFSYFTSCLVDRLEASFIIAPMRSTSPSEDAHSLDVIVVRPNRDGRLDGLTQDDLGDVSAAQITKVMEAAYQSGSHLQTELQDGQAVVEYFRCGGWKWVPGSTEQEVCVDGKLIPIPPYGSVECIVLHDAANSILLW